MQNNQLTVLAEKVDGGFLQNIWYDVQITAKRSEIEIKANIEKNKETVDHDNLDKIFQIKDNSFTKGAVGFGINGVTQVLIDKFSFKIEECMQPDSSIDSQIESSEYYVPPDCNRFKEDYFGAIVQKYRVMDPQLESENGPSIWKYHQKMFERANVIYQSSPVRSGHINQIGSILLQK